jgi:hypothetical protein
MNETLTTKRGKRTMRYILILTMVFALALAVSTAAFAADKPDPAPKAPEGVKAVVKGKVASTTVNRQGQDRKVFEITVAEAKGADGKVMNDLKGQTLRLGPRDKAAEFEKFDGKNAEVTGTVGKGKRGRSGKVLLVESIK